PRIADTLRFDSRVHRHLTIIADLGVGTQPSFRRRGPRGAAGGGRGARVADVEPSPSLVSAAGQHADDHGHHRGEQENCPVQPVYREEQHDGENRGQWYQATYYRWLRRGPPPSAAAGPVPRNSRTRRVLWLIQNWVGLRQVRE